MVSIVVSIQAIFQPFPPSRPPDKECSGRAPPCEQQLAQCMVSIVVSIQMRKMFAEVRKMFVNVRHAEQDVRERQASRNF